MAIGKYFVLILPSINIELFNGGLPMSSANSMPVEVYKIEGGASNLRLINGCFTTISSQMFAIYIGSQN